MSDTIGERVIEVVARYQKVSPEEISLKTTFDELGMTSLDALGLIAELEEEFGTDIPNEDAFRIRDVEQAAETMRRLVSASYAGEGEATGQVG
ncbi:MAG TPA: acyl carrier protein [Pyrinomonadaceae bacterium]|jgi:acyl carrier protein|nr:acyl carrier protein [Pyrinomonadaceae bacterium]